MQMANRKCANGECIFGLQVGAYNWRGGGGKEYKRAVHSS